MWFDNIKFFIGKFSGFIENFRRYSDLSYIMEESYVIIFFSSFFITVKLFCKHDGIFCHTGRMSVGIFVFHIYDFCKSLRDVMHKHHAFTLFFFEPFHFYHHVQPCTYSYQCQYQQTYQNRKPYLLKIRFFLYYFYRYRLIDNSPCILHLHDEIVFSAGKIGIINSGKFTAVNRFIRLVKAFKAVWNRHFRQWIIHHISIYGQLFYVWRDIEIALIIGKYSCSVCLYIRHGCFHGRGVFGKILYIHFENTSVAYNIKITVFCQFTVWICCRNIRQTVLHAVIYRIFRLIRHHIFCRDNKYACTAQNPHFVPAVLVYVKIIFIRKRTYRFYYVVGCHICNGISCYYPVNIPFMIFFDTHDFSGRKTFIRSYMIDASALFRNI